VQNYRYYNIKTLPSSWAEALSVHILKIKSLPSFVSDETISKEDLERFAAFNNMMKKYNNDPEAAKNEARQKFEHTYWYYMLYLNPKVTNVLNNKAVVR
jgi:cytochrome b subunit of formate dehydrogenase